MFEVTTFFLHLQEKIAKELFSIYWRSIKSTKITKTCKNYYFFLRMCEKITNFAGFFARTMCSHEKKALNLCLTFNGK